MNKYTIAESLHRKVNFDTEYRTDLNQYGVLEFWTVANKFGDQIYHYRGWTEYCQHNSSDIDCRH